MSKISIIYIDLWNEDSSQGYVEYHHLVCVSCVTEKMQFYWNKGYKDPSR